MSWKWIILILLTLRFVYQMVLHAVTYRSAGNPTPANVADVYDAQTYQRWKAYSAEKGRLGMVSTTVNYGLMLLLLTMDLHAAFAALFPASGFWQMTAVVLLQALVEWAAGIVINYIDTMIIEQKYGFNRSSMKTFVTDQLRNLLLELALTLGLASILSTLYRTMGNWLVVLFASVMFLFTLLISFLYPVFSRIGNKFVPLEEGELKDRLMALLTKHGYKVKAIEVMDASRRTTKLNAYFTGFGKLKTIVLYDNLINAMSPDEICAVFAHELGHGIHKDVLKQQVMNLGNLLLMALAAWLAVAVTGMHAAFGFSQLNYGFAILLLNIGLGLIQPLTGMAMSAYSRRAEYRADRQAVKEGYGPAMITGLKKLAKENFAHLAPSKLLVVLEYSHPPLSQRIEAVQKALEETM